MVSILQTTTMQNEIGWLRNEKNGRSLANFSNLADFLVIRAILSEEFDTNDAAWKATRDRPPR